MKKKAMIEVQMNWVYIIIVGSIILIFFVVIGTRYAKNAEVKINAQILQQLDATVIGASQSEKSANQIDIQDTSLTISCSCNGNNCASQIEVTNSGLAKDISFFPIFSVKTIENSPLITWSQEWNAPFKVTNLLYITRDDVHFYITSDGTDGDEQFAEILYQKMKENKFIKVDKIKLTELNSIAANNLYLLRVIEIKSQPAQTISNDSKMSDNKGAKNIDLLIINPENEKSGNFQLYTIKKNNKMVNKNEPANIYLDQPTLLAMIFSEDTQFYLCNLNKALKHYDVISKIYLKKTDQLATEPALTYCQSYYNSAQNLLKQDFFSNGNTMSLQSTITQLNQINEQLLVAPGGSCPQIY